MSIFSPFSPISRLISNEDFAALIAMLFQAVFFNKGSYYGYLQGIWASFS